MPAHIYLAPDELWDFYHGAGDSLSGAGSLIAENPDYGVEIYLRDEGIATLLVTADDEEVFEVQAPDEDSLVETAESVYATYLSSDVVSELVDRREKSVDMEAAEELELIDERELELDEAVYDLLLTVIPGLYEHCDDPDEVYEVMKDRICEILFQEFGISVYRPMYLEDEGTNYFTQYPYPEIDFGE